MRRGMPQISASLLLASLLLTVSLPSHGGGGGPGCRGWVCVASNAWRHGVASLTGDHLPRIHINRLHGTELNSLIEAFRRMSDRASVPLDFHQPGPGPARNVLNKNEILQWHEFWNLQKEYFSEMARMIDQLRFERDPGVGITLIDEAGLGIMNPKEGLKGFYRERAGEVFVSVPNVADLNAFLKDPTDPRFTQTLGTLIHELSHHVFFENQQRRYVMATPEKFNRDFPPAVYAYQGAFSEILARQMAGARGVLLSDPSGYDARYLAPLGDVIESAAAEVVKIEAYSGFFSAPVISSGGAPPWSRFRDVRGLSVTERAWTRHMRGLIPYFIPRP